MRISIYSMLFSTELKKVTWDIWKKKLRWEIMYWFTLFIRFINAIQGGFEWECVRTTHFLSFSYIWEFVDVKISKYTKTIWKVSIFCENADEKTATQFVYCQNIRKIRLKNNNKYFNIFSIEIYYLHKFTIQYE